MERAKVRNIFFIAIAAIVFSSNCSYKTHLKTSNSVLKQYGAIADFDKIKNGEKLIISDGHTKLVVKTNRKKIAYKSNYDQSYIIFIFSRGEQYEYYNCDSTLKIISHSIFAGFVY